MAEEQSKISGYRINWYKIKLVFDHVFEKKKATTNYINTSDCISACFLLNDPLVAPAHAELDLWVQQLGGT